jgi:DNA-binding XRE family transcriptional regulator
MFKSFWNQRPLLRHQKKDAGAPDTRPTGCPGKKAGLACEGFSMIAKTNFDRYLDNQLKDPAFAARFKQAGEAWDVAMQLAALRKETGLSQKDLAERVGTSQQQISRLESPSYEGHSLSMIRRVAEVLGASVRVQIQRERGKRKQAVAESEVVYKRKR